VSGSFDQRPPVFDQTAIASDECRTPVKGRLWRGNPSDFWSSDDPSGFIDDSRRFVENPPGSRAAFLMLWLPFLPSTIRSLAVIARGSGSMDPTG
jgi:hypothetical protein